MYRRYSGPPNEIATEITNNDNRSFLNTNQRAVAGHLTQCMIPAWRHLIICLLALFHTTALTAQEGSPEQMRLALQKEYAERIKPIMKKYCIDCHGPDKQKGGVDLVDISTDLLQADDQEREIWKEVLHNLHHGDMPPPKSPQLSTAEHKQTVAWLQSGFALIAKDQDIKKTSGRVVMRRLTNEQYDHTIADLLQVRGHFSGDFMSDMASEDGFHNNGSILGMSASQLVSYRSAARKAIAKALHFWDKPKARTIAVQPPHSREYQKYLAMKKKHANDQQLQRFLDNKRVDPQLKAGKEVIVKLKKVPVIPQYNSAKRGPFRLRITVSTPAGQGRALPVQVGIGHKAQNKKSRDNFTKLDTRIIAADKSSQVIEFTGDISDVSIMQFDSPRLRRGKRRKDGTFIPNKDFSFEVMVRHVAEATEKGNQSKKNKPQFTVEEIAFTYPNFVVWPPASHTAVISPGSKDPRQIIKDFCDRAFRRPTTSDEVDRFHKVFKTLETNGMTFEEAVTETMATVLISPEFLYLVEKHSEGDVASTKLDPYALASRLSYFLWNSMPDEALLAAASDGSLHRKEVLAAHCERMMQDRRYGRMLNSFCEQWLDLEACDQINIDQEYFPNAFEIEDKLKAAFKKETKMVFTDIVRNNKSCMRLIDADFTYINATLARHYGIPGQHGKVFKKVEFKPGDKRGGILSHGSILLGHSNGAQTSIIKRGVWLRSRLFDDPPPPPPNAVPTPDANDPEFRNASFKQRLILHSTQESCRSCHARIDPWGIPLEEFDAVGRWRSHYTNLVKTNRDQGKKKNRHTKHNTSESTSAKIPRVDARSELPTGHTVSDLNGLKHYLTKDSPHLFARGMTSKLMAYAAGRSLSYMDQTAEEHLYKHFASNDHRFNALVRELVVSEFFRRP